MIKYIIRTVLRRSKHIIYYFFHYSKKLIDGCSLKELIGKNNCREKKIRCGTKNSDREFLIIRFWLTDKGLGFYAYWLQILGFIKQADQRGMIPIIDMKNWKTYIAGEDYPDDVNTWELYYNQYMGYTLEEVYNSKNVYICEKIYPDDFNMACKSCMLDNKKRKRYHELANKYFTLNDFVKKKLEHEMEKMPKGRIVGVAVRGSGYISNKPKGHAIQPSLSEVIDKVEECLKKWNCENIFLASEEEIVVNKMVEKFGDKVFYYHRVRNSEKDNLIPKWDDTPSNPNRIHDKYHSNIEYMCEIYSLAKCNCLIGSIVNGTMAALAINGDQYENVHIFNKGVY